MSKKYTYSRKFEDTGNAKVKNVGEYCITDSLYNNNNYCLNTTTISIDTIQLRLDNNKVMVNDGSPITLIPARINLDTGVVHSDYKFYRDSRGEWVTGSKVYYNSPDGIYTIESKYEKIFIRFSLPHYIYKTHNTFPLTPDETIEALTRLQDELSELGISFNMNEAILSRVDIFRNIVLDHPIFMYERVFRWMHGKRMNLTQTDTTFTFKNTRGEVQFYDKYAQVLNKCKDTIPDLLPNTMRVELRLIKADKCREILGISTLGELIGRLGEIRDIYKGTLKDLLFSALDASELDGFDINDEFTRMQWFSEHSGKQWLQHYRDALADEAMLKAWSSEAELRKVLKQLGKDSSTISKICKKMQSGLVTVPSSVNVSVSARDMYAEIYKKVMAE